MIQDPMFIEWCNRKSISIKVIQMLNVTWISCDNLHAWLSTQSRFIAMVSSLMTVGQASDSMTAPTYSLNWWVGA